MNRTALAVGLGLSLPFAALSHGQLVFEFTKSPGFLALETSDPTKASAMYSAAVAAGSTYSSLFSNPVTLKYTLDYGATPSGVLAYADSSFAPTSYSMVKPALISHATTSHDFSSLGGLPVGPSIPMFRNDTADLVFPEKEPFFDPTPGSVNNMMMDMCHSNLKALGLMPGTAGPAGSDATLKVSDTTSFDFDPSDGITGGTFDFRGVMLHEIGHAMGFLSGTDTMAIHLSSPPPVVDSIPTLTALDLFRYSPLSVMMGARDISLPLPGVIGDAALRFFSIDGGATMLESFSTGDGPFGFGDGEQGGHWKADGTFGLMDPTLAMGVNLTSDWDLLIAGGTAADLIALDVIGWTPVPAPTTAASMLLGLTLVTRRRRA
jgi:hypothetical protein